MIFKIQLDNINHFDINHDVIKSAALEFLCLTGEVPDTTNNVKYNNAFKADFTTKYELVITNPPYGGDKSKKSAQELKRDKIKKYIETQIKNGNSKFNEQLFKIKNLERLEKERKKKIKLNFQIVAKE